MMYRSWRRRPERSEELRNAEESGKIRTYDDEDTKKVGHPLFVFLFVWSKFLFLGTPSDFSLAFLNK